MTTTQNTQHFDVLIIGAGIAGIGAARRLTADHPDRTVAILEGRDSLGGTWDLFRYPGIRSDSDLQTFGYASKPWTDDHAIATADKILAYLREAASESGIERHIRFGHKVTRAEWSTEDARWTVDATVTATGEQVRLTAGWLYGATGYYDHSGGYTPDFPGIERFEGQVIHPQQWPEDLDYTGKRVVVIGSGATAVTLVPSMSGRAAHVTMLQRSPSYVMSIPAKDAIANALRRRLGDERGYALARRKNVWIQTAIYRLSRRHPKLMRKALRAMTAAQLPSNFDVDTHFSPSYNPWDERLCMVPNGDLFKAISAGQASVVTDRIAEFTPTGIRLESGAHLDADIVVTATGLNLLACGGIKLAVDGLDVDITEAVAYKGVLLSGIPNFNFMFGYTNASWTLRADLVSEYVARVLAHMDAGGYDTVVPEFDPTMETRPMIDLSSGYIRRGIDLFPRQGSERPWTMEMDYAHDVAALREAAVADSALRFASNTVEALDASAPLAVAA